MKQYTLLWITDEKYKLVTMKVFLNMKSLKEFTNLELKEIYGYSKVDLKPVDKDGYIWFVESESE